MTCFGARSNGVDPAGRLYMKAAAYDDDLELGRSQVGNNDADSCLGHHPDSRIYPSYTYPADEETAVGWTNREMLALRMDAHIGPNFTYPILPSLEVAPLC